MKHSLFLLSVALFSLCSCDSTNGVGEPSDITLPPGFKLELFADGVEGARSLARGDQGTIFVGTRGDGMVYAVVDNNNDHIADTVLTIASGLNTPNGVAFRNGSLYVATITSMLRYDSIESRLNNPPSPVVVTSAFPTEENHAWKYIAFGPDGKLYIPVGSPCNICEPADARQGTIMRMNADGSELEVFVRGLRNSVGFDWHPQTKELWFTDNGADMLGDNFPPDELNRATQQGQHFGFPYCHGGERLDETFGTGHSCDEFVAPAAKLGPHVAALGMKFYTGSMFPEEYRNQIFIAEHGSWNRSDPIGYRITLVKLNGSSAVSYTTFASGWLKDGEYWGRPVDVLQMPDGSLLVSDDYGSAIYRISYGE